MPDAHAPQRVTVLFEGGNFVGVEFNPPASDDGQGEPLNSYCRYAAKALEAIADGFPKEKANARRS